MIPSDHFVRFYNEVFKFLDEKGGLEEYYLEISHHQEFHCLENFRARGLDGIYDYYVKIRKEENCDLDLIRENEHCLILKMNVCPSLSKAMNNDAGLCKKYCLHCPGWIMPLYRKAGIYQVYDLMGLENPQCTEWLFDNEKDAQTFFDQYCKEHPDREILKNFPFN